MITPESPRLIADIGGLYARFAIELERGQFTHQASLRCADHASMEQAIRAYLDSVAPLKVAHAAIAVANPVEGDQVRMTNYHWQFSIEETRQSLGLDTLVVVNDFTALAMALPKIGASDARQVGGGQPVSNSVIGLLGSGTGLGVSGLIPAGDSWISLGSEGGHTSFSPRDAREVQVLEYAWKQFDHVSFERLLSGSGLELIHQALTSGQPTGDEPLSAPEITRRALELQDADCMATLDVFRTSVAAAALGFGRRALHESIAWARSRKMFGQSLGDFQITQTKIAQMATMLDAATLLTYRAAWLRDQGGRITREAAMAKMTATENAQQIIDMAVQMHGGMGVKKGVMVESLYREIRALRIYEGATEVQQLIIGKDLLKG